MLWRMALPAFNADGLLPPGTYLGDQDGEQVFLGHDCTVVEAEARFVAAFPNSLTRPSLWRQFQNYRTVAHVELECVTIYVSGEFVTDVEDPTHIHIALIIPRVELQKLTSGCQWQLDMLFNGREFEFGTAQSLTVTTDFCRTTGDDDLHFDAAQVELMHSRFVAGSPRSDDDEGGYLEIFECEGGSPIDAISAAPQG